MVVLEVDGAKCFDVRKVAARFNEFFTRVALNLVRSLPLPRGLYSAGSDLFRDFYQEKRVRQGSFRLSLFQRGLFLSSWQV